MAANRRYQEDKPGWIGDLVEAIEAYAADNPFEANIYTPDELVEAGVFEALSRVPDHEEIEEARRVVAKARRTKARSKFVPKSLPHPRHFRPEHSSVYHTAEALTQVIKEHGLHRFEKDFETLIDAVVAEGHLFFVPTPEEMSQAMRTVGLEPTIAPADSSAEGKPGAPRSDHPSDVANEIRRLQRAPKREGKLNPIQNWVQWRGKVERFYPDWEVIEFRVFFIQLKEYLDRDLPRQEVEEVLDEMVKEVKRAERRHKKRRKLQEESER